MPALIPKAFTPENEPFVWVCSDCDKLFSTTHLPRRHAASDLHCINRDFAHHSRRHHPNTVVVALPHSEDHNPAPSLIDSLLGWFRTVWAD